MPCEATYKCRLFLTPLWHRYDMPTDSGARIRAVTADRNRGPTPGVGDGMPKPSTPGKPTTAGAIDQGSARQNAGKPPLHLLPLDGLVLVAWVLAFGAVKYAPRGWEEAAAAGVMSWADCVRAMLSHMGKLLCGQRLDAESGLPHVAHIGCNALFLCAMLARGNGRDDLAMLEHGQPCAAEWEPGPEFAAAVTKIRAAKSG